jgi:hypothetical protein
MTDISSLDGQVVYSPRVEDIKQYKKPNYLEVWKGLPNLDFVDEKSRGGHDSLKYEQGGDYIWISWKAVEELKKNPNTLLVAHIKRKEGKVHAWSVDLPGKFFGHTLDKIIATSRMVNDTLERKD